MNRCRAQDGWTLFELMAGISLLMVLLLVTASVVSGLIRMGGRTSRGAVELQLAARFAEQFRTDVRQASACVVAAGKNSVALTVRGKSVWYQHNEDGRVVRTEGAAESRGPLLKHAEFALDPKSPRLLHARWDCAAEAAPELDGSLPEAGCALVLDTFLRAETAAEEQR